MLDFLKTHQKITTRFAPSPTGLLHVGSLRTALYSYLIAQKHDGNFILRIEDTDRERYVEGGVENILKSLYWAKIEPSEGVILNNESISQTGENGPYIQSERLPIYRKYAEELVQNGHAFYCFCTPERLAEVREERQKNKLPPGYDGLCKTLSKEDVTARLEQQEKHVIRLSMPDDGETQWDDLIHGNVSFKNSDVDDQVLLKGDGFPTYHLAVVVDDHEMKVTHVIRGDEWISSTPKHLQLYKYFGWDAPQFAHLPLLLNSDKSKLSKRQGDVAVLDYKEKGYLPEALINFVAFLGWNPGTEQEIFSLEELIEEFDLKKVNKAGAVFNIEKLDWYNREYLKKLSVDDLVTYLFAFLPENLKNTGKDNELLKRLAPTLVERISKGTDLAQMNTDGELGYFFIQPDYEKDLLVWKGLKENNEKYILTKQYLEKVIELIENSSFESSDKIKDLIWSYAEEKGRGDVLWPCRVALSGAEKSPDPFTMGYILGKDEALSRLKIAISKLKPIPKSL